MSASNGMPKRFRRLSDGMVVEALQYVRYPAGHTNWDTIHSWTGGLISYEGDGVSAVRSSARGARTLMSAGDPRWIVRSRARRCEVVSADLFAEAYEPINGVGL